MDFLKLSHELTACLKVRAKGKARSRKEGPDFRAGKHGFVPVT